MNWKVKEGGRHANYVEFNMWWDASVLKGKTILNELNDHRQEKCLRNSGRKAEELSKSHHSHRWKCQVHV